MSKVAQGTVKSADAKRMVLQVAGTNYELYLDLPASVSLKTGEDVQGMIRVRARKVWTLTSGGNYVTPLFGPPRVIQGKVKAVEGKTLVVQAGMPVVVDLPEDKSAYDLENGELVVGAMVNITALTGAMFEPVQG